MSDDPKHCPHCSSRTLPVTRIGGHVVAIMNCPCKEELLILYRDKVIPLKRSILEDGSFDDRKEHLGEIAARVFEWGVRAAQANGAEAAFDFALGDHGVEVDHEPMISEEEFRKFVKVDLKCLDNPAYFRRHFEDPATD